MNRYEIAQRSRNSRTRRFGEVATIKTEEQFIKDFGSDWRRYIPFGWNSYMDNHFGKSFKIIGIEHSNIDGVNSLRYRLSDRRQHAWHESMFSNYDRNLI